MFKQTKKCQFLFLLENHSWLHSEARPQRAGMEKPVLPSDQTWAVQFATVPTIP